MVQTRSATKKDGQDNAIPSELQGVPVQVEPQQLREGASPSKRRRRTKAEKLCQLNLDILFLIAEYIHPIDLLNLARTCKSLRTLLMDRSSAFVWKKARGQAKGLPDCPPDLTEPEYANLVFYARCHGCGKYAQIIFWRMRRRYCPACRIARFHPVQSCDPLIWNCDVLPSEYFTIDKYARRWVDREQMESFMQEYCKSSNKEDFLQEARERFQTIKAHASQCERWKSDRAYDRRVDLEARREARERSIFERLRQSGYGPEIEYFSEYGIRTSYKSAFRTSKLLTDKEWDRMWPEWLKIMSRNRERRLESNVYAARRRVLSSAYLRYVQNSEQDSRLSHFLPLVAHLANYSSFSALIRAPEGTLVDDSLFASAFSHIPAIAEQWMEKVGAEFAALVETPSFVGTNRDEASHSESAPLAVLPQNADGKLKLACALFRVGDSGVYAYPDALSVFPLPGYPRWDSTESEPTSTGPIVEEFRVSIFGEAAYIVHACGLDPSTATVEDMDRRNARLMCLRCKDSCVMHWRAAIFHARSRHPHSQICGDRWRTVNDEYIEAIQAIEQLVQVGEFELQDLDTRCLLCQRRVGEVQTRANTLNHLIYIHGVSGDDLKEGEHFATLDIRYLNGVNLRNVKMIEETDGPTFKAVELSCGAPHISHLA